MGKPKSKTELLTTQLNELSKIYIAFDGLGRQQFVYSAYTNAVHGDPCIVTEYIYTGPATTTIKARKEGYATWDSAWDADFTVSAED